MIEVYDWHSWASSGTPHVAHLKPSLLSGVKLQNCVEVVDGIEAAYSFKNAKQRVSQKIRLSQVVPGNKV